MLNVITHVHKGTLYMYKSFKTIPETLLVCVCVCVFISKTAIKKREFYNINNQKFIRGLGYTIYLNIYKRKKTKC